MKRPKLPIELTWKDITDREKFIDQLEQLYREECDAHTQTLKRLEEK